MRSGSRRVDSRWKQSLSKPLYFHLHIKKVDRLLTLQTNKRVRRPLRDEVRD